MHKSFEHRLPYTQLQCLLVLILLMFMRSSCMAPPQLPQHTWLTCGRQLSDANSSFVQAQEMQELNAKLLGRAQSVEQKHNLMAEHVAQMSECLKQRTCENETLQAELEALRKSMKVGRPAPCVF